MVGEDGNEAENAASPTSLRGKSGSQDFGVIELRPCPATVAYGGVLSNILQVTTIWGVWAAVEGFAGSV